MLSPLPYAPKPHRMRPKRFECPAHLAFVATLPCLCCLYSPVEVHHLLRGVVRGMSLRAGDNWTVPLCDKHHKHLHYVSKLHGGNEGRWFASVGILNPLEWASYFWEHTGDRDRCMTAICGRMME